MCRVCGRGVVYAGVGEGGGAGCKMRLHLCIADSLWRLVQVAVACKALEIDNAPDKHLACWECCIMV